jgi:hypothetical protein
MPGAALCQAGDGILGRGTRAYDAVLDLRVRDVGAHVFADGDAVPIGDPLPDRHEARVDVTDGACSQALFLAPMNNGVYLVDFTYRDHQVCAVTCVEQVATDEGDGTFQNRPCPLPTASQKQALAADRD